jgi:hypothetical protein
MKGPKSILAEAISNTLAEYFVVDQKGMETKLLSDAGIKLHDTQLQPLDGIVVNPTTTASVRGVVQYVAFQWHWGKSQMEGGSDWVNDVRLSISGLRFTITLSKIKSEPSSQGAGTKENKATTNAKDTKEKEATGFMAYVQDQVQKIIDTLTLAVDNVLFTVVLPEGSSVQFGGSGLEIRSLGRSPSPTGDGPEASSKVLLQKFRMQKLYSRVVGKDGENYPVLDDIFYEANIQRSVGNRFLHGLERGLRIEGDSDDYGVVIHAGPTQLEVLNDLVGMLVTSGYPSESASVFEVPARSDDSAAIQQREEEPSCMGLKLSGVSLVLPNGTKLSLADLILKYQFDGTLLRLEGKAGFSVDGYPFLALGETSVWSADLVQSKFRIEDTALTKAKDADEEIVAFFSARQSEIQMVGEGINQALGIYKSLNAMEDGVVSNMARKSTDATTEPEDPWSISTLGTVWSMELLGKVGCVVEQETNSEIGVTLRNIKADTETLKMKIDSIDECQIQDAFYLAEPIVDITFQFEGSCLSAVFQDIVVVLVEQIDKGTESEKEDDQKNRPEESTSKGDVTPSSFTLPFGLNLVVKRFLSFKPDAKSVQTTVEALNLKISPNASANGGKASIQLALGEINHNMFRLKQPSLGFIVDTCSSFDSIHDLKFGANEIIVAAGYSLEDWKSLIPKKSRERNPTTPLRLPFAHIDNVKVLVLVKGLIGVKNSVLNVPPFDGNETTTIKDVVKFYNKQVFTRVPGMIVNTEVLGANVGDGVVGHFGGGLIANYVGGASIGGLISVAAFDGVKNTIKAGKVSRGVEESEKWELSDLARGLKFSAIEATRAGAARRGKVGDERGDVLDWTVGATTGVVQYSVENTARLGGAGAGAIGFASGFALGGPVGAIIGTVVGSAATQKTIETVEDALKSDDFKKQKEATDAMIKDINPHATTSNVLIQGFLLKRRDFVKWDWRPHCFVLTEGELKYYDLSAKPPSGRNNPSGALYMDSSKGPHKALKFVNHRVEILDNLSNPKGNLHVFAIYSFEKNEPLWVLGAPTEQLRSVWVSQLSDQMSQNTKEIDLEPDGDGKNQGNSLSELPYDR